MATAVRDRGGSTSPGDRGEQWARVGWPAGVLRDQGMPRDEIHAIFAIDDPELVRRYLELHGERLQERLAADLRMLRRIESSMTTEMRDRFRRRTR